MPIHDFSSHNQVKNEAISFYTKRMIFRPLARNDLSFRETVVGFITGLNFPRQGQRSDLSDGRVNEQGRWSETVQEIESEKGRESERKSEAERRWQSDILDGTQTLVYPLTHPLPFYATRLTLATCIHTLRHTFAREYRPQSQTMPCRFCVPSPSLYYPVTREAYSPNKRINCGRIPWSSNHFLHSLRYSLSHIHAAPLYEPFAFLFYFHRLYNKALYTVELYSALFL